MKECRWVGVLVLGVLFFSPALRPQPQQTPEPVKLKPVSANLYEVIGGMGARGGCFIGDDGVLLIDAKMDRGSADQVFASVRKLSDKPLRFLINTHSDGDHVMGNRFFPRDTVIVAHENCRGEFFVPKRDGTASDWLKPEWAPFVPAVTYHDRMDIHLGSRKVELWYFGIGHTTGDTVVYFPDEKTAFIGDQAFFGRPQLIHSYKGGNSFEHVKTLTRMLESLPAERFSLGHDEMTDRAGILAHIDRMKAMQAKVRDLAAAGKKIEEITREFSVDEARLVETIHAEIRK